MQTYTETLGHKPFNWKQSLQARIRLNSSKCIKLKTRSNSWATCPCGNLSVLIPRVPLDNSSMIFFADGHPIDVKLSKMGMTFHYCIRNGNWRKALNTLEQIEKRASEILSKIS